jgi:acyl-CoA synthetase (AMP-forming)/AMP-acid ligase II
VLPARARRRDRRARARRRARVRARGGGTAHELRVRGPNVTPGTWRAGGGVDPVPLDELGFYPMGDAGVLAEPDEPARGVVFDGRLTENFKLSSGTWVRVGELRIALVAACSPRLADAVIAGHDRDQVGALVFPPPARSSTTRSAPRCAPASPPSPPWPPAARAAARPPAHPRRAAEHRRRRDHRQGLPEPARDPRPPRRRRRAPVRRRSRRDRPRVIRSGL